MAHPNVVVIDNVDIFTPIFPFNPLQGAESDKRMALPMHLSHYDKQTLRNFIDHGKRAKFGQTSLALGKKDDQLYDLSQIGFEIQDVVVVIEKRITARDFFRLDQNLFFEGFIVDDFNKGI